MAWISSLVTDLPPINRACSLAAVDTPRTAFASTPVAAPGNVGRRCTAESLPGDRGLAPTARSHCRGTDCGNSQTGHVTGCPQRRVQRGDCGAVQPKRGVRDDRRWIAAGL